MTDSLINVVIRYAIVFFIVFCALILSSLALDFIEPEKAAKFLGLSEESSEAFKVVISRLQEVVSNLLDSMTGTTQDIVDKSRVDVDVNNVRSGVEENLKDVIKENIVDKK